MCRAFDAAVRLLSPLENAASVFEVKEKSTDRYERFGENHLQWPQTHRFKSSRKQEVDWFRQIDKIRIC
jgi:hypothetical protein